MGNIHDEQCNWFDGFDKDGHPITKCFEPWSNRCTGMRHDCLKLKLKWLASLSNKERKRQNNRDYYTKK